MSGTLTLNRDLNEGNYSGSPLPNERRFGSRGPRRNSHGFSPCKAKARLVPIETKPARSKLRADEAFGLWKDRADQFWSIVGPASPNRQLRKAIQQAIAAEREENDVGVLGGMRSNSHPRRRPGKSFRK
jgi:hypothetical protein